MASTSTLRLRRSAAQWHALQNVEREIRATDNHSRRKYLRDFQEAFRTYESVLTTQQVEHMLHASDIVLIGDYHALASSQRYAAEVVRSISSTGREVVLALETIFARDQHIVDEWLAGEIEDDEFRERIRFDSDWGYDWAPFSDLMHIARESEAHVYGLDCMPRGDLRRIHLRDRHAADKIAELREHHPEAAIVVLFGESHLAPNHLPARITEKCPTDSFLTVLQNIDPLYWRAAGERAHVDAVRVTRNVICVFNATPLEKYETYRLYIDRWRQERTCQPDLAPTFYNLADALLRSLGIDKYSPVGASTKCLVDVLPEVHCRTSDEQFRRLLTRGGVSDHDQYSTMTALTQRGIAYVPQLNAVLVREFQMNSGTEEAARFLHHACRGAIGPTAAHLTLPQNDFYKSVMTEALADFGARMLFPGRPIKRESDLYALYSLDRDAVEDMGLCTFREFMQMIDFLVLHKDYETSALHYREMPELLTEGTEWSGPRRAYSTRMLGAMLGSGLHDAYLHGRITKRFLRSLYFRDLERDARTLYFVVVRRLRKPKRKLLA
jgi:hypothetical protein